MPPRDPPSSDYQSKYLRDSVPGKYRDLEVNIVTRVDRIDITPLIIEISIFEDLKCPFLKGELIFADNSGLMTALPIVGQEEVEIKFTRAGHSVEKVFACTSVVNIEKVAGEVAGVVMTLTSKKHLTNAVKQFSKAYSGLASDIIESVHFDSFKEHIDVKSKSGSAHRIVFPFIKPYAAIDMIMNKTFGEDGTPYFLYENLFGDGPILQSYESMLTDEKLEQLPILTKNMATNNDDLGQGTRFNPGSIGQLLSYEINKTGDTLRLLSRGALVNNTIRINFSNNSYKEVPFFYGKHAAILDDQLDQFRNYEVDEDRLESNLLKPSRSVEMHNPLAFETEGVTELHTQQDDLALTKRLSRISRMGDLVRISAYADSSPSAYMVGKCVNLIVASNLPPLDGTVSVDQLFSGRYIIGRLRHYIKGGNYQMSMELIREGLSKPSGFSYVDTATAENRGPQ